jgi:hypothetical protein
VIDQITQALEFAYSKGWVHGRLTPHNILLGPDQSAVLGDYGMQRALRLSPVSSILQFSTYDAQYLTPDVLHGKPASPAADQFALACTLVEMLAGVNPFAAPSLAEVEQKHTTPLAEPLFPTENAPWQISRVLQQALSPRPEVRFKNASELVAALSHATSPGAIDPDELRHREEQVQAWRQSEQQARQQAEETARLVALEQARREIQEQAHREVEALELLEAEAPEITLSEEPPRPAQARRKRRRPAWTSAWPALAIAAIILVALASFWLDRRLSTGGLTQATQTATTFTQPVAKGTDPGVKTAPPATATATASQSPTQAITPTASVKPSATLTRTNTATKKPSLTPSMTPTPSRTPLPSSTFTPIKPEKRDRRP